MNDEDVIKIDASPDRDTQSVDIPDTVDWNDSALKRWLGSITRMSTKYQYRTAFRAYTRFTGKTASAFAG